MNKSIHKYNSKGRLINGWEEGYFSVTTILDVRHKKNLWYWKMAIGQEESSRIAEEAAQIGTKAHRRLEQLLNGQKFKNTPVDIKRHIDSYHRWADIYQPTDIKTETFVYSDKYGYAGTADLICKINGEDWLIDFKTSKNTHPKMGYGIQVKAYAYAYEEMTGVKCRMGVLQLGMPTKKGWMFRESQEPMNLFIAHKIIFDWQLQHEPIKEPKVKV